MKNTTDYKKIANIVLIIGVILMIITYVVTLDSISFWVRRIYNLVFIITLVIYLILTKKAKREERDKQE